MHAAHLQQKWQVPWRWVRHCIQCCTVRALLLECLTSTRRCQGSPGSTPCRADTQKQQQQ